LVFFVVDLAEATDWIDSASEEACWDGAGLFLAALDGRFTLTQESNEGATMLGATTAEEARFERRLGFCELSVALPALVSEE
jgi:hypothetical protein